MIVLLALLAPCLAMSQVVRGEVLISQEEASLPVHPSVKGPTLTVRSPVRKPTVEIENHTAPGELRSPLNFSVKFKPHGGAQIDLKTVRVTYLRSPQIDLTSRLKSFISVSGIDLTKAEVPPGEHFIKIELQDTKGIETQLTIKLIVKPGDRR